MAIWYLRVIEYGVLFIVLYFTVVMLLIYLLNRNRMTSKEQRSEAYRNYEPVVSFIIPAHNEENGVRKSIESVLQLNYPKEKLEIVVINDGSTDKTGEIVEEYRKRGVILINNVKNIGKAESLNVGIKKAKGEVVVTMDADSYITKNSLKKVLMHFDEDVAAVTTAIKVKNRKNMGFLEKLQKTEYLFTIFNRRIFSFINSVYVTPGPFSAFKKTVFDEIGGFDGKNIMEDQEIALRIQAANYRIVSCIDAVCYSDVPKTFKALLQQRIRWNRGGLRNTFNYAFMANPKYGDFGLFVMPYSIASIFLLFIVASIVVGSFIAPTKFGLMNPFLLIEPLHLVSLIVLTLTVAWTYIALRGMNEKVDLKYLLIYIVGYVYLITLFMAIAVFQEIKRDKVTW